MQENERIARQRQHRGADEGDGVSIKGSLGRTEIGDAEATTILFGGKYHFGSRSLVQRDRHGAGLQGSSCVLDSAAF